MRIKAAVPWNAKCRGGFWEILGVERGDEDRQGLGSWRNSLATYHAKISGVGLPKTASESRDRQSESISNVKFPLDMETKVWRCNALPYPDWRELPGWCFGEA